MRKLKKISIAMMLTVILSLGISSVSSAANCTSWETYSTSYGNCLTSWCNPIWKPSGLKQEVTEKQSRICNIDGGTYSVEYRTLQGTECNC